MKTLAVILLLVSFSFSSYAQRITELEETKISFSPLIFIETDEPDDYRFKIKDGYDKEFTLDPIGFMESYFNIDNFIQEVGDKDYDFYLVNFSNENGFLEAKYSKEGELDRTRQIFKNAALPVAVRNELWRQTEGWSMVKNTYVARGKGNRLDKELYRIKVVKNNKAKIIKIDPKSLDEERIAGI
ncbi:hypothetical protein [Salegentibacter sp. Hel_I_6]|uniref:hypothetical protein n=1 Tax=Salegentibacter sp. Hel_I_6 TaxID=1250278 RepID=UPI00055F0FC3|nr:hypothetical protein [Salegentibacter sp. Hel_I_6]